jgi:hypothetical protein
VPNLPDDHFEIYLRQFRPQPPEQLPVEMRGRSLGRLPAVTTWAAVAALVIAALLIQSPRVRPSSQPNDPAQPATLAYAGNPGPLTIQSARVLLREAPSFDAALNAVVISSHPTSFSGKQSAVNALSEDPKL